MGSILNQITTLHDHPPNSLFDPAKFIVLWDMDQTLLFARLIKTSGNMFRVEWAARPGIFPVLEELNKEGFQQGVFTAAIQPYADNLLDKFDKGCFFGKRRFYRNHTVGGKKDLTAIVGPQLERVVLVDDNALTVVPPEQRKHAILINRWLGEQDDKTGPPEYNLDKVVPAVRALRGAPPLTTTTTTVVALTFFHIAGTTRAMAQVSPGSSATDTRARRWGSSAGNTRA